MGKAPRLRPLQDLHTHTHTMHVRQNFPYSGIPKDGVSVELRISIYSKHGKCSTKFLSWSAREHMTGKYFMQHIGMVQLLHVKDRLVRFFSASLPHAKPSLV